jgi:hypothetical protein
MAMDRVCCWIRVVSTSGRWMEPLPATTCPPVGPARTAGPWSIAVNNTPPAMILRAADASGGRPAWARGLGLSSIRRTLGCGHAPPAPAATPRLTGRRASPSSAGTPRAATPS